MNLVTSGVILAASTFALVAKTLNLAHFVPPRHVVTRSTIEPRYKGLSEAHRAASDGIAGRWLSPFAKAGWLESANAVTDQIKADGDNRVIELSGEEAAAFNTLTEPMTQQIVGALGAEDVLSAMRGE